MNSNIKTGSRAPLAVSLAVALAGVLGASNAFADDQVRTESVNFQDLNVDTSTGAKVLYSRIYSAAQRVCSETQRILQGQARACVKRAEAQAIENLNLPALTAYYRAKTSGGTQPLSANR